jgi:hypothetical protein
MYCVSYLIASILLVFGKYTTILFLNSRGNSTSGFMNKTAMVSFAMPVDCPHHQKQKQIKRAIISLLN